MLLRRSQAQEIADVLSRDRARASRVDVEHVLAHRRAYPAPLAADGTVMCCAQLVRSCVESAEIANPVSHPTHGSTAALEYFLRELIETLGGRGVREVVLRGNVRAVELRRVAEVHGFHPLESVTDAEESTYVGARTLAFRNAL